MATHFQLIAFEHQISSLTLNSTFTSEMLNAKFCSHLVITINVFMIGAFSIEYAYKKVKLDDCRHNTYLLAEHNSSATVNIIYVVLAYFLLSYLR